MQAFASFFGNNIFLAAIILAMIPALENRVALPFALSMGLSPFLSFLGCFVGGILIIYPVIFLTRRVKGHFAGFLSERYSDKLNKLSHETSNLKKLFLLASFVAIPLPMTGVWSGSVIGGLTSLKMWQVFLAISIGYLVSSSVILLVCLLFAGSELYVLLFSLILLAIFICYEIISIILKKHKRKRSKL